MPSPCSVVQACRARTVIPARCFLAKSTVPLAIGSIEAGRTVADVAGNRSISVGASAMVLARTEYVTRRTGYVADSAYPGFIGTCVGNEMFRRLLEGSDGSGL